MPNWCLNYRGHEPEASRLQAVISLLQRAQEGWLEEVNADLSYVWLKKRPRYEPERRVLILPLEPSSEKGGEG